MKFNLNYPSNDTLTINLTDDRLPVQVETLGPITCQYELKPCGDYYQLTLITSCQLTLYCQRCMKPYDYHYENTTKIGLCDDDVVAERIMDTVDPVVLSTQDIPFESLLIDELILYMPSFHEDEGQCAIKYA